MFISFRTPGRVVLPWRRFSAIALLSLLMCGCQDLSVSARSECEQVGEVIATAETIPSYKGRSAAVYRANQLALAADRLGQIPIEEGELALHSVPLVALYRQSSDLILQETAFMEDNGTVSVAASSRAAYQQVSLQRAELTLQVQAQHDLVKAYCEN